MGKAEVRVLCTVAPMSSVVCSHDISCITNSMAEHGV